MNLFIFNPLTAKLFKKSGFFIFLKYNFETRFHMYIDTYLRKFKGLCNSSEIFKIASFFFLFYMFFL